MTCRRSRNTREGVTEKKEEGDKNSNLGISCRIGTYSTKCTFCRMRRALLFNYISYASSVNPDSDVALPSLLLSPIPRKYQGFSYSFQTTNQIDRFPSPIDSIPISPFIITPFPFPYGEKGESRPWKRRKIRRNENGEILPLLSGVLMCVTLRNARCHGRTSNRISNFSESSVASQSDSGLETTKLGNAYDTAIRVNSFLGESSA